jgi:hypothetical protein
MSHGGDGMVDDLLGIYSRIVTVSDRGKWRERVECLRALEAMSWWDNWGEHVYNVRMSAVVHIAHDTEDIPPELAAVVAEARDAVDYVDMSGGSADA